MAKNKISIDFPISGEWRILRPPGHHPFAFDFVKMDDDKKRYSRKNKFIYYVSTISSNEYYSWNQNIYSPIDGKVIPFVFSEYEELQSNGIWKKSTFSVPKIKAHIIAKNCGINTVG
jgi:hypothetical protein